VRLRIGRWEEDDPWDDGHLSYMDCCGLVELSGVQDSSIEVLRRNLRAAKEDYKGMVIATTTRPNGVKMVKRLGFKRITCFTNPNTGNKVTVWLGRLSR